MKNLVQMKRFGGRASSRAVLVAALMLATLISGGWAAGAAGSNGDMTGGATNPLSPAVTCPGGQCFTDVPPSSPFFDYINNLYLDGIIGGYACGGAGEPCDDQNRAYYRPGANVSRGQMSKFEDLGRRKVTGVYTPTAGFYGIFTAINDNRASSLNAGVYAAGATGVWGSSTSTGSSNGYGGYFYNNGGGTGRQAGVFGGVNSSTGNTTTAGYFQNVSPSGPNNVGVRSSTANGYGVYGSSDAHGGTLQSSGVVGISTAVDGAGGVFSTTAASGLGVRGNAVTTTSSAGVGGFLQGRAGLLVTGGSAVPPDPNGTFNPAIEVHGGTGLRAIDVSLPTDTTSSYSFYGVSRIHGSNVAAASYSLEMVYHGTGGLQSGDVVALDGNNETINGREALGVVKVNAENAPLAAGVAELRLNKDATATDADAPFDPSLSSVRSGDLIQVAIAGTVKMQVGKAKLGDWLAVGSNGNVEVASEGASNVIGKVAGTPDKDGYVTVLINMK